MRIALALLLVLSVAGRLHAQPEPSGALEALAIVPASALLHEHGGEVVFTDWAAAFASRGAEMPAAWSALGPQDSLTELALTYPPGAPHEIVNHINLAEHYPELLGIDLFQITASVKFGDPAAPVLAVIGEFGQELVQSAFSAQDYVVDAEHAAWLLLCPAEGCDQGTVGDPENRDPTNPFGGQFGRRQPALLAVDYLISAASQPVLVDVARVLEGAGESLASLREVQAVAASLSGSEFLLNLTIVDPERLNPADAPPPLPDPGLAPGEAEAWLAELASEPLPHFPLFAFASLVHSGVEHGRVILVYSEQQQADLAAASLEARLKTMPVFHGGQTFSEFWSRFGELTAISSEAAADMWVVTVQMSAPMQSRGRLGLPFNALIMDVWDGHALWVPSD